MIKEVEGYKGRYLIQNDGVVFATGIGNSNNCQERQLKQFRVGKDRKYLRVRLYNGNGHKDFSVHRLVATHFIPNPKELPHINHKDENTFNNSFDNLEWCTAQYNKEFSSSKEFEFISPDGESVKVFNLSKFCRNNNLSNGCMYLLLSGKYKQHKGWTISSSLAEDRIDSLTD